MCRPIKNLTNEPENELKNELESELGMPLADVALAVPSVCKFQARDRPNRACFADS